MSKTPDKFQGIELLLLGIEQHCDSSILKQRFDKCSVQGLKDWRDDNSLDLLHHCILNNNVISIILFFNRGLFKPPYEPSSWPYLHLISCLGHRGLITTIIQEIRYQNQSLLLDWKVFDAIVKPKMAVSHHIIKEEDKSEPLSPIDLASLFGHPACVQLLLDFWQFQNASGRYKTQKPSIKNPSIYLSLACQANSPPALRLMLEEHDDKKEALECAIRMSSAECVDVVLRDRGSKLDIKSAFQGMNLFHVLYSYSRCISQKQLEAMVEVTSVLIFHKQDVNSCRPSRTFPLYSLLNKTIVGVALEDIITGLTSGLLLLLKAGADPNVDEILIEKHVHDKEYSTAFGRKPFSSAVHCLISSVAYLRGKGRLENTQDKQQVEKYSYNCLELLLRHGADLSHVGKFYEVVIDDEIQSGLYHFGTALHVLFSTRNCNQPSYPFLRLLLHYGIDTDVQGLWYSQNLDNSITFALNVLPFAVWTHFNPSESETNKDVLNEDDLKSFIYTMKFMSNNSLYKAFQEFNGCVDNLRNKTSSKQLRDDLEAKHLSGNAIYLKMVDAFILELGQPWSLQRCCSHVIWRSCGLHMGNVFSLNIPTPLRNIIMHHH